MLQHSNVVETNASILKVLEYKNRLLTILTTYILMSADTSNVVYICYSGDTVCTCIKRDEPGVTSINFLINCKVGFKLEVKHNLTDFYYPTLCLDGLARLHVVWTNDPGISDEEKETALVRGQHRRLLYYTSNYDPYRRFNP